MYDLLELFKKKRPVHPVDTLDAEKVVSVKDYEESTPNGHIRGRTVIEYVARDGSLKEETFVYYRCDKCGEKVYAPVTDFLCERDRTRRKLINVALFVMGCTALGIVFLAVAKYIVAGAILYAIYWANKKKPQKPEVSQ